MVENATRTDRKERRGTCNESEKDDEIGLCRRRRDSTERAGVPQTGRRLSGMQSPVPRARAHVPPVSVGLGSSAPSSLLSLPSSLLSPFPSSSILARPFLSVPNPLRVPPLRATQSSTTTITNYGTQAQVRTHGRAANEETGTFDAVPCCVCTCTRAMYTRVYTRFDDATSRPLTAISAAGHQRVPTGPNRPGRLASVTFASAPLTCLSRSFSFSSSFSRFSSRRPLVVVARVRSFLFLAPRPLPP